MRVTLRGQWKCADGQVSLIAWQRQPQPWQQRGLWESEARRMFWRSELLFPLWKSFIWKWDLHQTFLSCLWDFCFMFKQKCQNFLSARSCKCLYSNSEVPSLSCGVLPRRNLGYGTSPIINHKCFFINSFRSVQFFLHLYYSLYQRTEFCKYFVVFELEKGMFCGLVDWTAGESCSFLVFYFWGFFLQIHY